MTRSEVVAMYERLAREATAPFMRTHYEALAATERWALEHERKQAS